MYARNSVRILNLLKNLEKTGEEIISECAVKDRIWGIGLSMKDENRHCIDKVERPKSVRENFDACQGRNQTSEKGAGINHGSF